MMLFFCRVRARGLYKGEEGQENYLQKNSGSSPDL
jgi:hypothetical protein